MSASRHLCCTGILLFLSASFAYSSEITRAGFGLNLTEAAAESVTWYTCRFIPPLNEAPDDDPGGHKQLSIRSLIWLHIPKTGSGFEQHIRGALQHQLKKGDIFGKWIFGHDGLPLQGPAGCLAVPWSMPARAPRCRKAVGFFREPDQRFMSAFYHQPGFMSFFTPSAREAYDKVFSNKGWGLGRRLEGMLNISGCEIYGVQTKMLLGHAFGNTARTDSQGHFLGSPVEVTDGGGEVSDACGYQQPRMIAKAVINLRSTFPFVGLTSDWYPSICLFRALAGETGAVSNFHNVHMGSAHAAARAFATKSATTAPNELFEKYARENPRCEGLSPEEEKRCAVGTISDSGLVTYRTMDLIPGYADCADEIVYAAAASLRWHLALRAVQDGAVLLPSLLQPPARRLPETCRALNDEVAEVLREFGGDGDGNGSEKPRDKLSLGQMKMRQAQ